MKIMSVKITDEMYPIAIACLPAGFACLAKDDVYGSYLVINKPVAHYDPNRGREPYLTFENTWCSKEDFEREYQWVTPARKNQFAEIELKHQERPRRGPRYTYRAPVFNPSGVDD